MRKNQPFLLRSGFGLVVCLMLFYTAFAQQPVIATHPRIFLDATTKAALIAKKNANDPDWQAVLAQANKYTTGTVIPWDETSASDAQYYSTPENIFYSYCGSSWEEAAMTLALAHQVTKTNNAGANPTIYSNKLLQFADVIIKAYQDYPPNSSEMNIFQFNDAYATRHVGKTIAVIYDHCYDELGATRKAKLLHVMKDWFQYMSAAPSRVYQLQDQPTGNYFVGQLVCAGYMGLAISGDDPIAQKMIDFARQRLIGTPGSLDPNTKTSGETANNYFTQSVKGGLPPYASSPETYLGPHGLSGAPQVDGLPNQGWSYGGETIQFLVDYLFALKSATGEDLLQTDPYLKTYFQKASIALIHAFTPNRFQIDNGNDFGSFIGAVADYALVLRLTAILEGTTEGTNIQYFYKNQLQPVNLLTYNVGYTILNWTAFYYNKTRTATSYTFKPYYPAPTVNTYSAIAHDAPMHRFYMRHDWGATSSWAAVTMGAGDYDAHYQYKAGHFKIVRGDSHDGDDQLLIGANEVASAGGNGINGASNYSTASSASNTLFIDDYDDYDIPFQQYPSQVGGQAFLGFDEPTHEEQNDKFSYFRADLTSAYYTNYADPDTTQRTLRYYYRSFLYLRNSDIYVVYDKLQAKNSTNVKGQYKKHLRWHFLSPPTVSGGNITEVTDNSKLYIHTVLPATTKAVVVNENHNPDNTFGSSYDYLFDTNTWRAEVSVTGNPLKQDIVTVLQPGSKTGLTEMVTTPIQTVENNMEGSAIAVNGNNEVVLFNKDISKYPPPVASTSYSYTGPHTTVHSLCGVYPNQHYKVTYYSNVILAVKNPVGTDIASPAGVLNFVLSNNADLSALTISSGTLTPAFAAATTAYTDQVSNATTSVKVTPTVAEPNATVKVNGVDVVSGSPSQDLPLVVGQNVITVEVRAQDGTLKNYIITVTRLPSNNADLSALTVSDGTLTPAFAAATTTYTDQVSNATTSVKVTPTVAEPNATITVNGTTVVSGSPSGSLPLVVGANTITVKVTAQDGTTIKNYIITVTRAPSADAGLNGLSIDPGTLAPVFATGTTAYTASVGNAITSVQVTPTASEPNATITVNGATVASGTASGNLPLVVGANTITVKVTAQDGTTTKTYTITVNRAAPLPSDADLSALGISSGTLSPVFASGNTIYTAAVANRITTIKMTPTASEAGATIIVNGTTVASGTASADLPLTVGDNIITIKVTAPDGTVKTYTVTVNRAVPLSSNADLINLTLSTGTLSPAFVAAATTYTASVSNATASVQVTPTVSDVNATIKVNGTTVSSGVASSAIPLNVGTNVITTTVTAQDGTVKMYTITVTRAASANADLINLTLSTGTLSPTFNAATTTYTALVSNATTSVQLTPTVSDANATIQVNGTTVGSGVASSAILLNVGANVITTTVTAQDGSVKTYTVTLTRAASSNADLNNLTVSTGTLSPVFASGTIAYTVSVSNATTIIKVTPTSNDANAVIKVNGTIVSSGMPSSDIALVVGDNVITTTVTAQDGTLKTYTITVTRAASPNADLTNLALSTGTLSPAFNAATIAYTASVSNATTSVQVTPTVSDANATIKVNGTTVSSGAASQVIPLNVGTNVITTQITAQDGTVKTYTITVTRAASSNADLVNLTVSTGVLAPGFNAAANNYTLFVNNATTSIKVTPTSSDPNSVIKVNGTIVASGTASADIALIVGSNTIITQITAQDGTVKTYTVTVTRAASANADLSNLTVNAGTLSPTFAPPTMAYSVSVGNTVTSIRVTPTSSDPNTTIMVNGASVTSGTASADQPLVVGTNTITVTMTAQDGTMRTYTVTVTRAASSNADMTGLTISNGVLTPNFSTTTYNYSASVANTVASVKLTPTASDGSAIIKVNGTIVSSGTASGSIVLNVGPNTIVTTVTAQDGTLKTYTVIVTRSAAPLSTDNNLTNITISNGTLNPTFATGITNYTVAVDNTVATEKIIPTSSDAMAAITVNGTAVASGTASGDLSLVVGPNSIIVKVTAQDGSMKVYSITVIRAAAVTPDNAGLINIVLSDGAVKPAFNQTFVYYSALVNSEVAFIKVTPTASSPAITIRVNGSLTVSGTASAAIPLKVGINVITIICTIPNGASKAYTITITRKGPGLKVHNGVSPNGDGINEFFLIEGLENYPDNKVIIMDPTGTKVFEISGYDNNSKLFDGHSSYTGSLLRAGTYFYQLSYKTDAGQENLTGYLILKYQ